MLQYDLFRMGGKKEEKRMKKYIGVILIALLVLVGCGGGSKSSQGKAIIDAVYEYNKDDAGGYGHYGLFNQKKTNATVYESGSMYYVLLEEQSETDSGNKYIYNAIYRVRKHEKFEVSQSDIEAEYDEDILKSVDEVFYEEKNVELVEN